jgi:HEAT repeat protein
MKHRLVSVGVLALFLSAAVGRAAEPPSPQAADAIRLIESGDPYQRQLGFLRLEALREPATAEAIKGYVDDRDPEMRAWSLRALAAIEGSAAVPRLREKLQHDPQGLVRRAALLGLEVFYKTHHDLLPVFLAALRDRDVTVRMAAVDVVSRIDDPIARQAIRERYRREHRKDVRRVLEAAMKRLGS